MTDYLDLDRRFMPFQDENSWEVQYQSFLTEDFYGCESWPDLLSHKRSVILSEAGAGKTTEMHEKAKSLLEGDMPAFYITVNSLAQKGLRDALFTSVVDPVRTWRDLPPVKSAGPLCDRIRANV